jgi:hypothetical protein
VILEVCGPCENLNVMRSRISAVRFAALDSDVLAKQALLVHRLKALQIAQGHAEPARKVAQVR